MTIVRADSHPLLQFRDLMSVARKGTFCVATVVENILVYRFKRSPGRWSKIPRHRNTRLESPMNRQTGMLLCRNLLSGRTPRHSHWTILFVPERKSDRFGRFFCAGAQVELNWRVFTKIRPIHFELAPFSKKIAQSSLNWWKFGEKSSNPL